MNKILRDIYRCCRDWVIIILKIILFVIPKDNKLFLFNAWFGQKYSDNTMYLYEYFLENTDYKVMWTTKNIDVFNRLKEENKPVVMSNTLKGIYTQIRAKVIFSTIQLNDFNQYFLSKCIYIDLDHGIIFKQVGYDIDPQNKYIEKHERIVKKYIDYYMTTPSYLTQRMMTHSYHISEENTILCGKPRFDFFFDDKLRGRTDDIEKLGTGKKIIVYMPTHRSCGKVSLNMQEILDLDYVNDLCYHNQYLFILKKHFYHRTEEENLIKYSNIIDITNSSIDVQKLLYCADVLITDYSSVYIDYLLLDRPIVLYTFDMEQYLQGERGLFVPFNLLDIGYQPMNSKQLNECLARIMYDKTDMYRENRERAKKIYFDETLDIGKSRAEILEIVREIVAGNYMSKWKNVREREEKRKGVKELVDYIENI